VGDRLMKVLRFLIVFTMLICNAAEGRFAFADQNLRPFTVADSISMTHIDMPSEEAPNNSPPFSPSHKKFLVVTEKGILDKNLREYSLLVYNSDKLTEPPSVAARFSSSSNRPGITQAQWIDDSHVAFIGELPGGTGQVYVVNCSTGDHKKLTTEKDGVVSYALSQDQKTLVYYTTETGETVEKQYKEDHGFAVADERLEDLVTGNWRKPMCGFQLHVQDLLHGKVRTLPPIPIWSQVPSIWLSPDGKYAIAERDARFVPRSWELYEDSFVKRSVRASLAYDAKISLIYETVLLNTETMELKPLVGAPSSVGGSLTSVAWAKDSRSAVIAATLLPLNTEDSDELAKRREHPVIAAVDIPTGLARRIIEMPTDQDWEIQPGSTCDSFQITGWTRGPGLDDTARIPTRSFHREGREWKEDQAAVEEPQPEITIHQSLNEWPVLVGVDRATHKEKVIFDPNPQFRHFRFGRREVVNWTGKKGEPLTGGLVYPVDYAPGNRYPLVIQTHGFSPSVYLLDGSFTTAFAAEALANNGVLVLQLPESPLEQIDKVGPGRGPAMQSQLESAIDYLDRLGLIDRERVGLVGFSMTGFAVVHTLMKSSYHFAVATSAEGNDWGYWSYIFLGNSVPWASQSEGPYGGPPWNKNWEPWLRNSISFNYDKIHTPLRLESDGNDHAQIIGEWENFVALKRLHKPVDLIFVSHGEHPVVKPWDRMTSQQGNVEWLLFWLKNEEDPDPAKSEQYARWHGLRKLQEQDEANTKAQSGN
jgi:dipeptidyl aminopeptidase/acylaminoacyl peptidase